MKKYWEIVKNYFPIFGFVLVVLFFTISTSEHLGSVYYLTTGNASILEKHKLADGRWVDYEEFKEKYYYSLESWSKAIFDFIYEDEIYSKLFGLAS